MKKRKELEKMGFLDPWETLTYLTIKSFEGITIPELMVLFEYQNNNALRDRVEFLEKNNLINKKQSAERNFSFNKKNKKVIKGRFLAEGKGKPYFLNKNIDISLFLTEKLLGKNKGIKLPDMPIYDTVKKEDLTDFFRKSFDPIFDKIGEEIKKDPKQIEKYRKQIELEQGKGKTNNFPRLLDLSEILADEMFEIINGSIKYGIVITRKEEEIQKKLKGKKFSSDSKQLSRQANEFIKAKYFIPYNISLNSFISLFNAVFYYFEFSRSIKLHYNRTKSLLTFATSIKEQDEYFKDSTKILENSNLLQKNMKELEKFMDFFMQKKREEGVEYIQMPKGWREKMLREKADLQLIL